MFFDPQLLAKVPKCIIIELLPIIKDKESWDAEAVNDAFPHEASDILLSDSGQRFCLDPFSKIVNPYNEELELQYNYKEGPHYVKPLLRE